jgi:hypothetical protein
VTARFILSLLALLALLATPFGHMQAHAHGGVSASPCHGSSAPAPGKADRAAIDCAIACAAIAPSAASPAPRLIVAAAPEQVPLPLSRGIRTAADPPPPRLG